MGRGKKFQQVFIATQRQNQYAMEASIAQAELNNIRNQRAAIVDPSSAVKDLSGTFSNPYANLGVATKAAEMQVEQTDAALANTLDTIRATGSGAGGATALAQAALQSKNSVSASIQQQEAQNQKLKAQGEQQLQQMVASEQQRVQAAKAAGMEFVFSAQEARTNADLDYAANKEQLADDRRYQAEGDIEAAVSRFRNPRKQFDAIFGGETRNYQERAASIYDYQ
jgi:hypothetical protein